MFGKIIKAFTEPLPEQTSQPQELTFRVEGVNYHKEQIETLAIPMKKWNLPDKVLAEKFTLKKIYKYYFEKTTATFVPEKDRLKVMINNMHVGYVPDREAVEVKKMLIHKVDISAQIKGGDYKVVSANGDAVVMDDRYSIEVTISRG